MQCVKWAIDTLDEKGRWDNFSHINKESPFGAMAQGEGVSVLLRAYILTGDTMYIEAAQKALDFMLLSIADGGTTKYEGGDAFLMEYTTKGMVLNGAVFAWWGLYDFVTITQDTGRYKNSLEKTLASIIKVLPQFKCSYWSMYSLDGLLASPFYHNLHIAQMQAMYQLTAQKIFDDYAKLWKKQQGQVLNKSLAFIVKAYQKIKE